MDMRRSRPFYKYKSYFWQLPGMIMMVIMVRARNYNYCCQHFWELYLLKFVASISEGYNC